MPKTVGYGTPKTKITAKKTVKATKPAKGKKTKK